MQPTHDILRTVAAGTTSGPSNFLKRERLPSLLPIFRRHALPHRAARSRLSGDVETPMRPDVHPTYGRVDRLPLLDEHREDYYNPVTSPWKRPRNDAVTNNRVIASGSQT